MKAPKTHLPNTAKDTGPLMPLTRCGLYMMAVELAPFGSVPTCKRCQRGKA